MKKCLLVLVIGVSGCFVNRAPCDNPGTMRCKGSVVETCTSHEEWFAGEDCQDAIGFDGTPAPMQCVDGRGLAHCEEVQ